MTPASGAALHASRSITIFALFALAAYPAWMRGGTPRDLQEPLVLLGLIAIALTVWIGWIRWPPSPPAAGPARWRRDPVFWGGLLFLGILAVQWHYAGRIQFFDPVAQVWAYTPPLRPGWPSAFTRAEAAEMLRWFFPAWAGILTVRSGILGRTGILALWRLLALNSAAVGILGIVQQQLARPLFPFTAELGDLRFFGPFGYENHAASLFVLMAALSAGLALRDLLSPDRARRRGRAGLMLAAFAANLAATHLSLSRAGILLAWILVLAGGAWGLLRTWRGMSPVGRVNALAGGSAVLLALAMGVVALGRDRIGREIASLGDLPNAVREGQHVSRTLGDRVVLGRAALAVFHAQPAFGVGGWGFRYLMPYTLPDDNWEWSSAAFGKANVHNDPLQFLAEFGGVGAGLMALCVVVMLVPAFRRDASQGRAAWSSPVVFFALAGLALVGLHSLIDLPFRCPAVLVSWTLVLAGLRDLAPDRPELARVHKARGAGRRRTGPGGSPCLRSPYPPIPSLGTLRARTARLGVAGAGLPSGSDHKEPR